MPKRGSLVILLLAVGHWMACSEANVGVDLEPPPSSVRCPSDCAGLFLKLQHGVQEVRMELQAEPKTGSSTTGEWARGALIGTCLYLQSLYGEQSCRWTESEYNRETNVTFEPELLDENAPCSCTNVQSVHYAVKFGDTVAKHFLPVTSECTYSHRFGIVEDPDEPVCHPRTNHTLESMGDLWQCVEDADCTFLDDEVLYVAPMRDPRAVTVSSYFYRIEHEGRQRFVAQRPELYTSVDIFFQSALEAICMWSSLRYMLFTTILGDRSALFWFKDSFADPVDFHGRFLSFAGLKLPLETVVDMARLANGEDSLYGIHRKGPDKHPGGIKLVEKRTFRDELNATSLAMMDDVVRTWMPPVLFQRFGIPS